MSDVQSPKNAIAIVGIALRFPGAANVDQFWRNLCEGVESISRFDDAELEDYFNDEVRGAPNFVKARPILNDVDQFDAEFYGMHAREAELTDPQHRVFLECAWEALEDGGCDPSRYSGAIGVFAGCSMNTYFLNNICADRRVVEEFTSNYQVGGYSALLGALPDFLATRVSYKLNLKGPSMTVQSACSTSLLAIAQACQSLLLHQSDTAIAGGVSITFPQKRGYLHQEGGMVSADGSCRSFDAAASGTIFGSGCGVVLLKRHEDAIADGDAIYAVIRGCGVNNDGAAKVGFTAPSVDGQAAAIEMALAAAEVDAQSISYVECHGTATPIGDPIEVAGLTQAFRMSSADSSADSKPHRKFCAIGSVKTNIGHLDAAAGVAGLIKTALSLQHAKLPPSLHFKQSNPQIDFDASPFYVNAQLAEWPRTAIPRRAGVSAFGVGGTNVHVVLEEAPATPAKTQHVASQPRSHLLVLSARTPSALQAVRNNLAAHLRRYPELDSDDDLADLAYSLQTGRRAFEYRCSIVCSDYADALSKLESGNGHAGVVRKDAPLVFMFPGQGSQYPEMGRGLYESEPVFRIEMDRCSDLLEPVTGFDLRDLLYHSPHRAEAAERLKATAIAQPAIFAIEYALAQLWISWGLRPQAMIGHSVGEFVAAVLAGVFSLEDALSLVAERGRLMQELPGGAMLAVRLPEPEVASLLVPSLAIAAINAPLLCVVSGPEAEIGVLEEILTARGAVSRRLHTSHAFHSPMIDPIIAPLRERLDEMILAAPAIPYVSCITGDWVRAENAMSAAYWAMHARLPVRFSDGITALTINSAPMLLEVGPGNTLTTLALQVTRGRPVAVMPEILSSLPSAVGETSDRKCMLETLGRLWVAGVEPDWTALHDGKRARVRLPTYPFERRRYWIDAPPRTAAGTGGTTAAKALAINDALQDQGVKQKHVAPTFSPPQPRTNTAIEAARATVVAILDDLSGEQWALANPLASFLELGFDSLFLSQVAQRLQSQLKIKITFRQLLGEFSTITALAAFLADKIPSLAEATYTASPFDRSSQPSTSRFDVYQLPRHCADTTMTPVQQQHVAALIARYTEKTAGSKRLSQEFRQVLADPRAAAGFRTEWKEMVYPIVCARSAGSKIWDVDGNEYVDLVNGYGQIAFGHAPDFVVAAVKEQLDKGFAIGPQAELAGKVAALFCTLTGNERMTFCNTGSEAVMAAMRVARAVTGRDKVVTFSGDYHGQFDEVLVKGVQRADTAVRSMPIATGIPASAVSNMVVLEYGAPVSLQWIREHAQELAAVLVEPVQSRHPDLLPLEFLQELRRLTTASGTALVMDEVVTGFRVHPGGIQGLTGIRADLATYGKVVGGGLPIGILAGKSSFMDALDGGQWQYGDDSFPQVGVTFFAGTFVRHPLALAACWAVLQHVQTQGAQLQEQLTNRTVQLVATLRAEFARYRITTKIENFSSWFYFNIHNEHPLASLLFQHLHGYGIHVQDGFPCFLTTAHSEQDVQRIVSAFRSSLEQLSEAGIICPKISAASVDEVLMPELKESASTPVPLTESQAEIWLAAQLGDAASCAFNESVTLHLTGRLNTIALEDALNRVVARHDALRASFSATGESMHIVAELTLRCSTTDLSDRDGAQAQQAFAELLDQDARTPFDLVHGPLIRAQLVRRSAQMHELILTMHHIICDGWSFNIVVGEFAALYTGLCLGVDPGLPVPLSFSSYARSQQQRDPTELARIEAYWLQQFQHEQAPLDLPADRPRLVIRSFKGASRCLRIDASLSQAVKMTGARQGCTLFVSLLAAFQALAGRLAGQEEVIVGVPTAGQSLLNNQGLVGHCVNFLPLRSSWTRDTPMSEFMVAVRKTVLDAYEHQSYTLGTLVRRRDLRRESNRVPLTQIQFNLERLPDHLHAAGLEVEVEPNAKVFVNFDLFFNVIESEQGLRIDCDYNTDLFDAATIDRWLACYQELLKSMIADVTQRVARLPFLPLAQHEEVLVTHNRTEADYPRHRCAHHLFEMQAAAQPQAIAVGCRSAAMTYAELDQRANQLAHHLLQRVGNTGSDVPRLIGILMNRSLDLPVALLATLKAGFAYVPLDPAHPPARLQHVLAVAKIVALISDVTDAAALVGHAVPIIDPRRDAAAIAVASRTPTVNALSADSLAYIIFTSGSTGLPKGVEITHRSLVNLLSSMARRPGLTAKDVLLAVTTVSFDIAGLELLLPLVTGARVEIAARDDSVDGFRLLELLRTSGANVMQATPSGWRLLLEAGFVAPAGFKMLCGGEALPRELADRLLSGGGSKRDIRSPAMHSDVLPVGGLKRDILSPAPHSGILPVELWNMYGPTETTIWSSCIRVACDNRPITVGDPIANTQFYILDHNDEPVPLGVSGQLHIGGDGVARGYHGRPELTAEKFIANPFGAGRIYRTGDLARRLPDGQIQLFGRMDHQIKLRGFRIELGEIESLMRVRAGVTDAAVVLREDTLGQPRLVAYFIEAQDQPCSVPQLRAALAQELPDYMMPSAWMRLDAFPISASGKLDRASLPMTEAQTSSLKAPALPHNELEAALLKIWMEVLRSNHVTTTDDVFALGIDSIQLFQIAARAHREGIPLTVKQLMQSRTIVELAKILARPVLNGSAEMHAVIVSRSIQARENREKFSARSQLG